MATAGYNTTLKLSGTVTAFNDAATTSLGSNRYQVTDATKRIIEPGSNVTVKDGVTTLASTAFSVDFLFGIVTLNSPPGGAVTVSSNYMPMLTIGEGRSATINQSRAELDSSVFTEDYTTLILGKKSASGDLERLALFLDDLDPGVGTTTFQSAQDNSTPKLLEVLLTSTVVWRGWVYFPGLSGESSQDGLVTGRISWKSIIRYNPFFKVNTSFGIGAP